MRVGSSEAERVDGGPPRLEAVRPFFDRARDAQAMLLEVDRWVARLEVQVRWDLADTHGQSRFDQAGNTRRRFEVPEIGLDRAEQQRRGIVRASLGEDST